MAKMMGNVAEYRLHLHSHSHSHADSDTQQRKKRISIILFNRRMIAAALLMFVAITITTADEGTDPDPDPVPPPTPDQSQIPSSSSSAANSSPQNANKKRAAPAVVEISKPVNVFVNGEAVPGYEYLNLTYGFMIPVLVQTNSGALLAFAQATVRGVKTRAAGVISDGRDAWIDIVSRRSTDGGQSWSKALTVVYRNSTYSPELKEYHYHACQQPTAIVDRVRNKIVLLSALDNWWQMVQESTDDGLTWSSPRNLDATLRRKGWGLIFTGLPVGIQLQAPNPHAGRLVACSSAYWSGGEMVNGTVVKTGDELSRYAYSILSDDGGSTWRIGSGGQIQPRHTTECSVAQSFDSGSDESAAPGALYAYIRIWDKNCEGCTGYGRGIAKSLDGGETWDTATLRGLPDSTPDVEGSFASSPRVTVDHNGHSNSDSNSNSTRVMTCFYVSAPSSTLRNNLTLWRSCGNAGDPMSWDSTLIDAGPSSYSSVVVATFNGTSYTSTNQQQLLASKRTLMRKVSPTSTHKVYDLWAWSNTSSPNACKDKPSAQEHCVGGIRFAEVAEF